MSTATKATPAPQRRKVKVNFVTVQERTAEMDARRKKALQRVLEINARDRAANVRPPHRVPRARTLPTPKVIFARPTPSYPADELRPYIGRPGAQHAFSLPSRSGSRLRYPDGRVTDLAGNPINRSES